ncbi:hypothetical protein [Actinotalea subterranea]|uniref:hypothetical protein n=1 Tax=Actinotalea subterranea TaxID=2607497 RepID=UPI0011EF5C57|nr:hypothetical protein [Actinotalea subterranea]
MTERNPGEIMQDVGRQFFEAAPQGWANGSIVYRRVGKTAETQATAQAADGTPLTVVMGRPVLRALRELRAAMARPGSGAWFTAVARFTSDGRMTWDFDHDHEPEWVTGISPLHYLQEQEEFPRDQEHTPAWLRERLTQGQALGGL